MKNQKIHSGKNALELLAKKYKQRKSLNTKSISRLVDVLRELKIKLLEKKDQQEIELLIKKDKQEENLEIEKISKLVDVLRVLNN
ncbi:hypothetical protein KBB68_04050 [Candidatus Babeliales bacterium]|nr:hypothetical protein [Candidatus Babeliales bacterium]